mmetsp:Transcript_60613/g.161808  ORF Transcript_60613/g.161808 Transcript_60613/m.161808 type:complete len:131 (+) Transcript_60613:1392-1784(+)
MDTGDMATLTSDGYMKIVDRAKDLVKSGGEWISSIDLEDTATSHPSVGMAAVIGIPHPKWDERPLLIVVEKQGKKVVKQELLDYLASKLTKSLYVPDDVVVVESMPVGGTGKIVKRDLKDKYKDHYTKGA